MDEILTTARDLELEVNEDDIEELIMGHKDELTTEELPRNFEYGKTHLNPMPHLLHFSLIVWSFFRFPHPVACRHGGASNEISRGVQILSLSISNAPMTKAANHP
ncbi:hypothetical protein TNCV_1793441 [Trichonephila clavipes]|nr:hypothetical protein TNCV_1793441 [Trichonephila clavipes]